MKTNPREKLVRCPNCERYVDVSEMIYARPFTFDSEGDRCEYCKDEEE